VQLLGSIDQLIAELRFFGECLLISETKLLGTWTLDRSAQAQPWSGSLVVSSEDSERNPNDISHFCLGSSTTLILGRREAESPRVLRRRECTGRGPINQDVCASVLAVG
jgi:hypothetical protein